MRWHYRDAGLLWLFPAADVVHAGEERAFGFASWMAHIAGAPVPPIAFDAIRAAAFVLLVTAVHRAVRDERGGWLAVAAGTAVLSDVLLHTAAAFATGTYSPGMITAVVFLLPLSALALIRAAEQSGRTHLRPGLAAGLLAEMLLVLALFAAASAAAT